MPPAEEQANAPNDKNKKKLVLFFIALVLLVALGAGAYWLYEKNKTEPTPEPQSQQNTEPSEQTEVPAWKEESPPVDTTPKPAEARFNIE